jgi:DNA-binding NarL/FixJ family response regulator
MVAVVDDDARMRHSIGNLLESAGHRAAMFSSADEFVHAGPPAEAKCLVLDVRMPGIDGLQLQHLLKAIRPGIHVIFVTAHYDEAVRRRAMEQGAAHFLRKPFDGAELLRTVDECMESDSEYGNRSIRNFLETARMKPDNIIRIMTVDDHHLIREGIATVIDNQPDMRQVSQASSGPEAIRQYREHRPDITLMDLRLPGLSGIDAMMAIRSEFPEARIVILTTFDGDVEVQRALRAGACGYLLKSTPPNELVEAIRQVYAGNKRVQTELATQVAEHLGEDGLSTREIEVLEQVVAGLRNREIAKRLFISEETVKIHLKHIMEKLGAKDRTHAAAIANRRGIARFDSDVSQKASKVSKGASS